MDAVVSDFLSGAAEILTPDAAPDHWDVIEGQGSLFHPAYAADPGVAPRQPTRCDGALPCDGTHRD